jgi:very-short-patch-repair endonuclease
MRKEATDAERRMWGILRSRRLAGFKFRRQCPVAGYIVDFYCVKGSLVVELDGGQHTEPAAIAYDRDRTRRLNELGIRVVRSWDPVVLKDGDAVAEAVYRELVGSEPSP